MQVLLLSLHFRNEAVDMTYPALFHSAVHPEALGLRSLQRIVLQIVECNRLYFFRLHLDPLDDVEYIQRLIVEFSVPFYPKPTESTHFHNILDQLM